MLASSGGTSVVLPVPGGACTTADAPAPPALQCRRESPQRFRKSQARPDDAEVEEALGAGWVQGYGRGSHASIVPAIASWPSFGRAADPPAGALPARVRVRPAFARTCAGATGAQSGASCRSRRHGFRRCGCRPPGQPWSPSASATVPGVAVQVATWVVAPRESTTTKPYSSGVRGPPGPPERTRPGTACRCTSSRSAFPTAAWSGIPWPPARCRLPG